jgi:WD40 repeat protein/predicted Ser/Thr protein kinase
MNPGGSSHQDDPTVLTGRSTRVPPPRPPAAPPVSSYGSRLPEIPGYELLGELGRGGMGVVYKARQLGVDRLVAIKMIIAGAAADEQEIARFRQEAEAVGRLAHPNIIAIYDVGEFEGRPYFALEFVDGGSLDKKTAGVAQDARWAAAIVEVIARGMHAAHVGGIIHRDLKPANILMTSAGVPKIADFGLAKKADSRSDLTGTQATMGTPQYMSPEQADGKSRNVGPAADIWSMGAILYALLTGRPPFVGKSAMHTLMLVAGEEPAQPRRINPRVPRDLETICLKCLQKDPTRRYRTAYELADDLRAFLLDQPIKARPVGPLERAVKWARRRPTAAALVGVSVLAGAVLTALALGLARANSDLAGTAAELRRNQAAVERANAEIRAEKTRADQRAIDAESARAEAVEQRRLAEERSAEAEAARTRLTRQTGALHCRSGRVDRGMAWLAAALQSPGAADPDERAALRALLGGWRASLVRLTASHHDDDAVAAVFPAPDGSVWIARRDAKEMRIFDGRGRKVAELPEHPRDVTCAALSPDRRLLATGCKDQRIRLFEMPSGRPLPAKMSHKRQAVGFELDCRISVLAFSRDGRRLISGSEGNMARIWSVPDGAPVGEPLLHHAVIGSPTIKVAAFSPDGRTVVTGSEDGTARLWDAATGRPLGDPIRHDGDATISAMAFSPDGRVLFTGGQSRHIRLWDAATGAALGKLPLPLNAEAVALSPDGRVLAVAGVNGSVWLWENAGAGGGSSSKPDFRRWREFAAHQGSAEGVVFAADGRSLWTWGRDKTARRWGLDGSAAAPVRTTPAAGEAQAVHSLAWSPDGRTLAAGCDYGRVRLWNTADARPAREPLSLGATVPTHEVGWSADGRILMGVAGNAPVRFWGPDGRPAAEPILIDKRSGAKAAAAALSPDGRRLLGATGNDVHVYDLAGGGRGEAFSPKHPARVTAAAWSPDGRTAATACKDNSVRLWDAETGRPIAEPLLHGGRVSSLAFSGDGRRLVTGCDDGRAYVWDMAGKPVCEPLEHDAPVAAVAVARDGHRAVTGDNQGVVRVWDIGVGQPLGEGFIHPGGINAVALRPDGLMAATAGADGIVRFWNLPAAAPDDPVRIRVWVAAQTGLELEGDREVRLSSDRRRERLEELRNLGDPFAGPGRSE